MSGWIRIGSIDLPALSLENPSYEAHSGAVKLVRFCALCVSPWCKGGSLLTASQQARQAHNLKVIGSNPIPQPSFKPLRTYRFQGLFAVPNLPGNFARGSAVEAAGGKSQRKIGEGGGGAR